jgi:hypothetical protein
MSQLINELAEKSTNDVLGVAILDKVKLAEAIVEECLVSIEARKINELHTDWEQGYQSALTKVAFDIKTKFGVE